MHVQPRSEVHLRVVYDTVCPWCYIGKRRFEQALALRPHLDVRVHWMSFLLNPDMPADGIERQTYLSYKFGGAERAERVYATIGRTGEAVGLDFQFSRIRVTPNSVDSHRLVRLAARDGDPSPLVESLFRAYFEDGVDIGERTALADIAAGHGLDAAGVRNWLDGDEDRANVLADNTQARRLGINGVPAYVAQDHYLLSGAQEPAILARILDVAAAQPTMENESRANNPEGMPDAPVAPPPETE